MPITSIVSRIYPFQVLFSAGDSGLDRDSEAQAEQVSTPLSNPTDHCHDAGP